MMSEDSSKVAAVQLRVPDTNTPANPNTQQQQQQQQQLQRSSNGSSFPSEYSLFELETFFTRWAPDNDSASPSAGPSCPFTADNPTESDQDGVFIVESKPSVSSAVSLPASCSSVHIQPSVRQAGASVSTHLKTPIRSSQRPWSRTTAAIRLGQVPSAQSAMSSSMAAVSDDKQSVSRTMSSTTAPQAALSVRGSAAVLAGIEAAIAAQQRASFLARRNKSLTASTVPADRRKKSYVCRACGKAFSGLSNLEAHERVHTGEKPFRCNTCGKHFSEAGNLKKHQRVHTGEKPFSCDQCGKRFAWICNLRTHQQSATGCGAQARAGLGLGLSSHTINCGGQDADASCISHT